MSNDIIHAFTEEQEYLASSAIRSFETIKSLVKIYEADKVVECSLRIRFIEMLCDSIIEDLNIRTQEETP